VVLGRIGARVARGSDIGRADPGFGEDEFDPVGGSRSPARAATMDRTCSYPVNMRNVGARPYDFIPAIEKSFSGWANRRARCGGTVPQLRDSASVGRPAVAVAP